MPFFLSKTNVSINDEQEKNLKFGLAQVVRKNFSYVEEYILAEFEDNCKLYLRGTNTEPIVYIEVKFLATKIISVTKIFSPVIIAHLFCVVLKKLGSRML